MLCVGTIEPRKNHGRVLQAFERFAAGRPHALVLVGSFGWLCDDVRRMLAAASARVVHLEGVPDDALAALYRAAQFTVYASLYEGFGLPVLESMTQGVPVLTTRGGALPEVGGDAVLYAAAEDVADLARAMERLAEDADLRRDLALRGRQRAGRFTWRATAAATADVYRDVVQRGT